jgi:uncharacterized protein (DUF2141 family)
VYSVVQLETKTEIRVFDTHVFGFMRNLNRLPWSVVVLVLFGLRVSLLPVEAQQTGEIVVRVVGLASDKGIVRYGLYDSAQAFKKGVGSAKMKGKCFPIKEHKCEFKIPEVPYGGYAIMVFHDENQNGKFDWSFISRERAGASNYTERLWRHPDFEKAKFDHAEQETILEICVF